MKTTILSLLILFSINSFSQDSNNVYIVKQVDDMTDKVYYYSSEKMVCQNDTKTKGFSITFMFDGKTDNSLKIDVISMKIIGLDCVQGTKLLFLFEDDSKLTLTSWNKFNCKGTAWFDMKPTHLKKLSSNKIKKIRVQNGRNQKSYTHEIENQTYLMDLHKSFMDKDIRAKE